MNCVTHGQYRVPQKRRYFELPPFADNDLLDLQDFLVHLRLGDPASPSSASHPFPHLPIHSCHLYGFQIEGTHQPLAQRHIPNEENTRAPRAAKVNATDLFAWVFWGTSVVGCGRG